MSGWWTGRYEGVQDGVKGGEKECGKLKVRKPGSQEVRKLGEVGKLGSQEVKKLGVQEVRKVERKVGVGETGSGGSRRPYI